MKRFNYDDNPWVFNNEPLLNIPDGVYGFVYELENKLTGDRYIGRKYFYSVSGRGKKAVKRESNWKGYWSSSNVIKTQINDYGKLAFKRTILSLCYTARDTNEEEVHLQWFFNVLHAKKADGSYAYINDNISGKYFRRIRNEPIRNY